MRAIPNIKKSLTGNLSTPDTIQAIEYGTGKIAATSINTAPQRLTCLKWLSSFFATKVFNLGILRSLVPIKYDIRPPMYDSAASKLTIAHWCSKLRAQIINKSGGIRPKTDSLVINIAKTVI